jgi:5-(carboxyamino)imidazole ribonucleotide synthase
MVNILGDSWVDNQEPAWDKAMAHNNLKLHLYSKEEPRRARKMGHFTVIGRLKVQDKQALLNTALIARSLLNIG